MSGAIGTKEGIQFSNPQPIEFKSLSRAGRRHYERAALRIGAPKEAAEDEQFRREVDKLDEQTTALATELRAALKHDAELRKTLRVKNDVKETKVTPAPEVGEKEGQTDGVENE